MRVVPTYFAYFALALLSSLAFCFNGCSKKEGADTPTLEPATKTQSGAAAKPVIAMLPKLINIDYFDACKRGAEKTAGESGVTLIYDGPTEPSGSEQNKFFDTWIRQGVQAICVAPNQPKTIKRFVEKSQQAGIKVLTWDSDAPESGRDLFVNQVDERTLGERLMDDLAKQMGEEGEWAIAIASL